ncbi:P-II family nitrogen regulator [Bacillota bacterium LX-D]|nr:P-II family nitrogen regulator [Bacillota bacterium LX-D]
MKKIEAVIRPTKLEEVKKVLDDLQVRGMTVYDVMGKGLQQNEKQYYRGQEHKVDLFHKVKIEIICRDHWVDRIIDAIVKTCQTGKIGDGKIFVYPLEQIVRIRTNERGEDAL